MTDLRIVSRRMLVIRADDTAIAISATELVAIDRDQGARVAIDAIHDLSAYVPHVSLEPSVRLIIEVGGQLHAIRARGELDLVETATVYRLPRLIRDTGCAPWLVGLVVLDHPIPWIDLSHLVTSQSQQELQ